MAENENEIGTGTGTGTKTADPNVTATATTVVAGIEVQVETAIGIGIGIEVGVMMVQTGSVYGSGDLPADLTLRATTTQRWASARAGGGTSRRGPEAGTTSTSPGQVEIGAHEAHNTKEGICDSDNIHPELLHFYYYVHGAAPSPISSLFSTCEASW
jgi:hypothetical protein